MSAQGSLGQRLLPVAAIVSAVVLGVSNFLTMFEINAAGGDALQVADAVDQHWYVTVILAAMAIGMVMLYVSTGRRPFALAAAGLGVIALLIFLIGDLPDVNRVGDLSDPVAGLITAKAEPAAGFWLELVGALGLALSAGVMALFAGEEPEQRAADYQR